MFAENLYPGDIVPPNVAVKKYFLIGICVLIRSTESIFEIAVNERHSSFLS